MRIEDWGALDLPSGAWISFEHRSAEAIVQPLWVDHVRVGRNPQCVSVLRLRCGCLALVSRGIVTIKCAVGMNKCGGLRG